MSDAENSDSREDSAAVRAVRETYRNRVRHLANIRELPMRSRAVLDAFLDRSPREALVWVDQFIRGSVWGRQNDLDVALGFVFWLVQNPRGGDHYEFFQTIYRLAHEHDRDEVLALLRNPPAQRQMAEEADLPDVRLPFDRDDIPTGERRTIARRADRDTIKRLVFDPEPLVIENLLDNPDLTEREVLKIASRRPTKQDILRRVVAHPTWFARGEVRKALVMNPFNDTGRSLKLLPTIGIASLRKVRYGSDVHSELSDFATRLVEMRESHTSPWEV